MRTALALSVLLVACNPENNLQAETYEEPLLTLEDPAAASWMQDGLTQVHGRAVNLQELSVNELAVTPADGLFTTEIDLERGVNLVEARGVDQRGDPLFVRHGVLAGDFADPDFAVEDALFFRVNENGFEVLLDAAADQFTAETVAPMLAAANPVYEESIGFDQFELAAVEASITDLAFDRLSLTAVPTTGALELDIWIPNLDVTVDAAVLAGGNEVFSTYVSVGAERVEARARATVEIDAGQLAADVGDVEITLVDFHYDLELLPDEIEAGLMVDTIAGYLETMLSEQLEERLPEMLDERLAELEIAYETELLGRELSVEGFFTSAAIDNKGLQLGMDLDLAIPGDGQHDYAGYLRGNGNLPQVDKSSDLSAAVSDDLVNDVLFEAWRSGILARTLSTEDGTLEPAMLAALGAEQGSIVTDAVLPPVLVERGGKLQAQISELLVTIETPGGEIGEHLELALTVFLDVDPAVSNGVLALEFGEPEVTLIVRESDWGATNETTTALLEDKLPLDTLLALLGDFEIPLPVFAGIAVDRATTSRSQTYTGVQITLD